MIGMVLAKNPKQYFKILILKLLDTDVILSKKLETCQPFTPHEQEEVKMFYKT